MKKLTLVLALICVIGLVACGGNVKNVKITDYSSKIYSDEEIQYLKEVFKLSEGEAGYLVTAQVGEGLLKVGNDTAILKITPTKKEFEFVETNLNKLANKQRGET